MTLTINDLNDFKHREKDMGCLTMLPVNFSEDLKEYMARILKEAGPHPGLWPQDCETFAAIEVLEEIFGLRRSKIENAARCGQSLNGSPLLAFESVAYNRLIAIFKDFDLETRLAIMGAAK